MAAVPALAPRAAFLRPARRIAGEENCHFCGKGNIIEQQAPGLPQGRKFSNTAPA